MGYSYTKLENIKIFDWCSMPDEIRDDYWDYPSNDSLFWFWVEEWVDAPIGEGQLINNWLIENGANPGERVLVEVSW